MNPALGGGTIAAPRRFGRSGAEAIRRQGGRVRFSPPVDYRHPAHFADLMEKVSQWDIREQVALLGPLPREDVLRLMRQSICVLNPSLFEGYGMTVDEARSVGKQVLVSDILAHREQDPPRAVFFDPRDCEDLAGKLEKIWRETPPGPDFALELEARGGRGERLWRCADDFMSVVREVVPAWAPTATSSVLS